MTALVRLGLRSPGDFLAYDPFEQLDVLLPGYRRNLGHLEVLFHVGELLHSYQGDRNAGGRADELKRSLGIGSQLVATFS